MVKYDKVTDLTDQIRNSYQSLIDEIENISFCNEIIIEIIDDSFNYKEGLFIKDIQESFIEYIDEVGLFVDSCEDNNHVGKFLNDNFDQDIFSYVWNNLGIEDYFDYWAYAIAFLIDEGFIKQMDFPDSFVGTIYYKDGYVIIDSLLEREGEC